MTRNTCSRDDRARTTFAGDPERADAVVELSCPRCGKPLPLLDVATCVCGTWLTPFAAAEVLSAEERRVNRTASWRRILRPCPICGEQMLLRGAEPGLFQGCDHHGYWIDDDVAESTGLSRGIDLEELERKRNDPRTREALRESERQRSAIESLEGQLEERADELREAGAEQARARQELEQARAETAALRKELRLRDQAAEGSAASAAEHERQVASLTARLEELSGASDALRAKLADIAKIEAERDRLARELASATEDRARDGDQATRLRAKLEQRDHDLRRSEDELARARRDLDQLGEKAAALDKELEVRAGALGERERQIAKLNGQLDTTDRKLLEARREIDALGEELRTTKARAKELFEANDALRSAAAQDREQRAQLEAARAEEARVSAKLQQNLNRITSTLADYQRSVQDLENQRKELEVNRHELEQVVESQQRDYLVLNEARKRVELMFRDLQQQHHHLDVSHELVKGDNAKLAQDNASMRAELTRLQLEIQRLLRDRVVDCSLQDALIANEELRKELERAQRTIVTLTADRETFDRLRALAESHERELLEHEDARGSSAPDLGRALPDPSRS